MKKNILMLLVASLPMLAVSQVSQTVQMQYGALTSVQTSQQYDVQLSYKGAVQASQQDVVQFSHNDTVQLSQVSAVSQMQRPVKQPTISQVNGVVVEYKVSSELLKGVKLGVESQCEMAQLVVNSQVSDENKSSCFAEILINDTLVYKVDYAVGRYCNPSAECHKIGSKVSKKSLRIEPDNTLVWSAKSAIYRMGKHMYKVYFTTDIGYYATPIPWLAAPLGVVLLVTDCSTGRVVVETETSRQTKF